MPAQTPNLFPFMRFADAEGALEWLSRAFGFNERVVYARAKAAGAEIVREIEDTPYESREYTARDPEGHVWSFGTYRPQAT